MFADCRDPVATGAIIDRPEAPWFYEMMSSIVKYTPILNQ